ncbi:class A beta-lactamase [Pseudomonas machongensis]
MLCERIGRLLFFGLLISPVTVPLSLATQMNDPVLQAAKEAERALGARVGYAIHDTDNGRTWQYRADERFPMASTVKVLVCSALLHQGPVSLARTVHIQEHDILPYAPVTQGMVGEDVSASRLCAITLETSDNTAVNGVLKALGGPATVTAFLRSIGDQTTRADRSEPELNEGRPGDKRDTTSPQAMQRTLEALVLGTALDKAAQAQLTRWMESNKVSGTLLRNGLPNDWRIADRSGSGGFGSRGVVAVMWPPGRGPIVAAIYLTQTQATLEQQDAAIAAIGRSLSHSVMRE